VTCLLRQVTELPFASRTTEVVILRLRGFSAPEEEDHSADQQDEDAKQYDPGCSIIEAHGGVEATTVQDKNQEDRNRKELSNGVGS
jgi:hypothetical protein